MPRPHRVSPINKRLGAMRHANTWYANKLAQPSDANSAQNACPVTFKDHPTARPGSVKSDPS